MNDRMTKKVFKRDLERLRGRARRKGIGIFKYETALSYIILSRVLFISSNVKLLVWDGLLHSY